MGDVISIARRWWGQKPKWRDRCAYRYSGRGCHGTGAPPLWMPSNKLYESDMGADSGDAEYAPASNSALLPRKRPLHGKLTAAILGGSICLNAMLVLYCVNLQFMKPLAYDRGQELAYLQMKDRELMAQKASLERTTEGLMQQKEQLLQHYKETESVGRKLEIYKEKLRADAQEVKDAEAAAEVLMQRLATAQGKTISAQQQLSDEKAKLATAKKEIDKVRADEKALKRDEKTDKLVRALQHAEMKDEVPAKERADLCHDCTCVKYC